MDCSFAVELVMLGSVGDAAVAVGRLLSCTRSSCASMRRTWSSTKLMVPGGRTMRSLFYILRKAMVSKSFVGKFRREKMKDGRCVL